MSTIDERVVELQFDNAQFEAGVQTSLGTIERLKSGLNLEGAAKGLEGLSNAGKSFSLANVADNIETVAHRCSALGVIGDQALRKLTNTAIGMGKKLLTAIPNQMWSGGKARAQNIEAAKFQIQGLAESWDDLYTSMDKAVSGTAYGIDAAAKAASQLVASNVAVGTEMDKALRGISGVAAMTNSTYEDIARVFTTVAGNGRLMGDQLNQLSSRGLNVAATLAEAMGKSEQEIREMVSKGKISFKEFAEAMDDAFGEHATKANKTFTGALSNIKASLSRMGQKFAAPTFDALRDVFNDLLPVMKAVEKIIQPIADKYSAFVKSATVATSSLLRQVGEVVGVDWAEIDLSRAKAAAQEAKEIEAIELKSRDRHKARVEEAKAAKESAETIQKEEEALVAAEERYSKAVQDKIDKEAEYQRLQAETGEGAEKTADKLNDAADKTEDAAKKADVVRMTLSSLGAPGAKLVSVYDTLTGKVNTAAQSVTGLKNNFMSLLGVEEDTTEAAEEATESVINVDELANDVIKGLYGNGEERKKALEDLGLSYAIIQNRVNELLGVEKRHAVTAEDEAKMNKKLASSTQEAAGEQAKQLTIGEKLKNIFLGLGSAIRIVTSLGQSLFKNVLIPFASWVGSNVLSATLAWPSMIGEKLQGLEAILTPEAFDNFFGGIANSARNFKTNAGTIIGTIGKLKGIKALSDSFKALGDAVRGFVQSGWQKVTGFFKNLNKEGDAFDESKFMGLYATINNLSLGFSNFINNTLAGEGPLAKVFTFLGGIFDRLKQSMPHVVEQFMTFFSGLKNIDGLTKLKDAFSGISQSLSTMMSGGLDKFTTKFNSFFDAVDGSDASAFDKVYASINKVTTGIANFLNALRGGPGAVVDFFKGIIDSIKNQAAKVTDEDFPAVKETLFNMFDGMKEAAPELAQKVISTLSSVFSAINWELVFSGVNTGLQAVGTFAVKDFLEGILGFLEKNNTGVITASITKFFGDLSGVAEAVKSSIGSLTSGVTKIFDNIADSVTRLSKATAREKAAGSMLKFAIAIGIVALALIALSAVPADKLKAVVPLLGMIAGGLVAMYAAIATINNLTKTGGGGGVGHVLDPIADSLNGLFNSAKKVLKGAAFVEFGLGMTLIVASLFLLMGALTAIAHFDTRIITKNIGSFIAVFGAFALLAITAKIAGKGSAGFGLAMISMAASLLLMAKVFETFTSMNFQNGRVLVTLGIIYSMIIMMGAVIAIGSRFAGDNVKSFGFAMVEMGLAMIAIAAAIKIIAGIDEDALGRSVLAMSGLLGLLTVLAYVTKGVTKKSLAAIVLLGVLVAAIATVLLVLSKMKPERLITTAGSLSAVILSLAAAVYAIGTVKWSSALAGAISLGLVLAAVVAAFYVIDRFDISTSMETAGSLSLLALGMAVTIRILGGVDWVAGGRAAVAIIEFVGLLGGAISALGAITELTGTTEGFVDSMNAGMKIFGAFAEGLGESIGKFVGGISKGFKEGKMESFAEKLTSFMTNLMPFLDLTNNIPKDAVSRLETLTKAISGLVNANFMQENALAKALTGGANLETFVGQFETVGKSLRKFSKYISKISTDDIEKLDPAIQALADLAAIRIENQGGSIADFFGDNTLTMFSEHLPKAAKGIGEFADEIKGHEFTYKDIKGAIKGIEALASIKIENEGGKLADFFGDNTIEMFTKHLPAAAKGIGAFADEIKDHKFKYGDISAAIKGIEALAAIKIENEGGELAKFFGDNTIEMFTNHLPNAAEGIVKFAEAVKGKDFTSVGSAARAISAIAKIDIPNEGGKLADLIGDNTLGQFSKYLPPLGVGIKSFAESVKSIQEGDVTNAVDAIQSVANIELPKEGGFFQAVFGSGDLTGLSANLATLGPDLNTFVTNVSGITADSVQGAIDALNNMADTIHNLSEGGFGEAIAAVFGVDDFSQFQTFADGLKTFGVAGTVIQNVNLSGVADDIQAIVDVIKGAKGINTTALSGLTSALQGLATEAVQYFYDGLTSASGEGSQIEQACVAMVTNAGNAISSNAGNVISGVQALIDAITTTFSNATDRMTFYGRGHGLAYAVGIVQMLQSATRAGTAILSAAVNAVSKTNGAKSAGNSFGSAFAAGIKDKTGEARAAAGNILGSAKDGLKNAYSDGKTKGESFGQGFADGIKSKRKEVKEAAQVLRNAAKAGAGGGGGGDTEPHTSKPETMGETYGISFAVGLYSAASEVYTAGENLSRTVTETLANPLKVVQKVLDSEFDPEITIKPVLDLSDIQNGAKTISRLIPAGATTVGSINVTPVNAGRASNDDVIAAIKSLADSLPDGGDTYVIEGITYDDGSYVADAVRTLVRAAKVQRRA